MRVPDPHFKKPRFINPESREGKRLIQAAREAQRGPVLSDLASVTDLASLYRELAIVRAAIELAQAGRLRVSASAISEHLREQGIAVPDYVVGQAMSKLKVPTRTSHGRTRFALVTELLTGITTAMEQRIAELEPQLELDLAAFDEVVERVERMHERVATIAALQEKRRLLGDYLEKNRHIERIFSDLRERTVALRDQAKHIDQWQRHVAQLEEQANELPKLKQRAADLKQRITDAEALTNDLDKQERAIAGTEATNARRAGILGRKADATRRETLVLDFVEMEQKTADAHKELDGLLRQLGEKQGLLARIRGGQS